LQVVPATSVEGLLCVEEEEEGFVVFFKAEGLDRLEENDVLNNEAARYEAILGFGDELDSGSVKAFSEDAHQYLIVAVEEGYGSIVTGVVACLFLIED
jgi:hypothetical protein